MVGEVFNFSKGHSNNLQSFTHLSAHNVTEKARSEAEKKPKGKRDRSFQETKVNARLTLHSGGKMKGRYRILRASNSMYFLWTGNILANSTIYNNPFKDYPRKTCYVCVCLYLVWITLVPARSR